MEKEITADDDVIILGDEDSIFYKADGTVKEILPNGNALVHFHNARENLSMGNIGKFLIPLPPLAEQYRIVAKVDELMKFCDGLGKQITEAKENGEKLMESVLGEIFR